MTRKCKCKCGTELLPASKCADIISKKGYASVECLTKHTRAKQLAKVKRDNLAVEKVKRVKHRELKESIKPLSKLKSEAQDAFNKYIRLRDFWEPCISCGKSKQEIEGDQGWKVGGCWDAGHFKSRGAKKQLRFVLFNVHKQCKSCNGGSGKFSSKAVTVDARYEENLIKKIGSKKVDWLNNNNDIVRFDADYYRRIKRIFNKKAKMKQARISSSVQHLVS